MCLCTEYDSPTCIHSWVSLVQPCNLGANLITCPYPQPVSRSMAPLHCCPVCNGSPADPAATQIIGRRGDGMLGAVVGMVGNGVQIHHEHGHCHGDLVRYDAFGRPRNQRYKRTTKTVREDYGGGCKCTVM
ncbi:hypothetical protein BU24DRAFT_426736 [Aaosphaeria arxii CBS 175.79]|uniref:Uncharacterized protein n=1 Tax=Aaosphaeria arxii CBS 175.79 TaxID=1450172 RepID=A0A6A5XH16_9PLEO|nr:uncharacterized protein BU24DRAFT_426736 [Aaosphaeria arxii CBS 175.79]KAF2011654.1 hypothetical protein BU24DRAFT_426736 [Aaosphaeria arxii CBS 175.79]